MFKNKIETEKRILTAMVKIYCRENHDAVVLCNDCSSVLEYALLRTEKCKFRENKPACKKCTTHCYNKENREKIKEIMRFSGKKMLFRHPVLSVKHLINGFNKQQKN